MLSIINIQSRKGFSLLELIISLVITSMVTGVIVLVVQGVRQRNAVVQAGTVQQQLTTAINLYFNDMGFYPPDVNRGWDPGFVRSMPWNPDKEAGEPPPGGFATSGVNCAHCPENWQNIIAEEWNGPYAVAWPRSTPWGGKYDYNYWGVGTTRYSCTVSPGVYVGVQGDYNNKNTIPLSAEEQMIERNYEAEDCINGESQMLLWLLK